MPMQILLVSFVALAQAQAPASSAVIWMEEEPMIAQTVKGVLPKNPSTVMPPPWQVLKGTDLNDAVDARLARSQHILHRLQDSVEVLRDSMRLMEESGLFSEDPSQETTKTKLARYQQLKGYHDAETQKIHELQIRVTSAKADETPSGSGQPPKESYVWNTSEGELPSPEGSHRQLGLS